jgi:hypothetical protein
MATARELIDAITELATGLPDGMDTEVELRICHGKNVQMVDKMDIDHWISWKTADRSGGSSYSVTTFIRARRRATSCPA